MISVTTDDEAALLAIVFVLRRVSVKFGSEYSRTWVFVRVAAVELEPTVFCALALSRLVLVGFVLAYDSVVQTKVSVVLRLKLSSVEGLEVNGTLETRLPKIKSGLDSRRYH